MSDNTEMKNAIVVADNGHVFVCENYSESDDHRWVNMLNARIIRTWGTTKGLNELIDGPLKTTVLDARAPVIALAFHSCIAVIPCRGGWDKSFRD